MRGQRIARRVRGREYLDLEALEERARPEFRRCESFRDLVVDPGRRRCIESRANAEDDCQLIVEPRRCRGAPKQVVVRCEQLPDDARVSLRFGDLSRDTEILHRDATRVEHPQDVVIGLDDEGRRFRKRRVVGQGFGVNVTVRTDDGQASSLLIEDARHAPDRRIGIEEPVLVQSRGAGAGHRQAAFRMDMLHTAECAEPAVDWNDNAGDKAGRVAAQPLHRADEFLGSTEAPHRGALDDGA